MMDRRISENEIIYLLDHLERLYSGPDLKQYLCTDKLCSEEGTKLYVPLSEKALDLKEVLNVEGIPVLFPCSDQERWYSVDKSRVFFHHDILKSAFYLLSGYQEYHLRDRDEHGRFPWKSSIQYQLNITQKPVVNYYFDVILEAFEAFCRLNKLEFQKKERAAPVLFLSHDIDRIEKYTLRNLAIITLQLLGLKKGSAGFARQLKLVKDYALGLLLFRPNPYWTFHEMNELEKELRISSTWFFLEKTRQDNSRYHFKQKKIRELITSLSDRGDEIGVHGTLESSSDQEAMDGGIRRLNELCSIPVSGIRQHYLKYDQTITPGIQLAAGLAYDASLGFAEQAGFRNSYAHPFRLFDFEKKKAHAIWQLPLNVMEASLIEYMEVHVGDIPATMKPLFGEVARFKGVFSLLWHNCRLDEEELPGIYPAYRQVLKDLMSSGFVSLTGREALESFISDGVSGNN